MLKYVVPLVLLAIAVATAALYWRFRQSPPALRAALIRRRAAELRDRLDALTNPARHQLSPAEKLAAELFTKQKQNADVKALQQYDNLGPATIDQLRKHGITNLIDAEAHVEAVLFKKKIEGLGDFRERALAAAVTQHMAKERRRFDDGASPEGAEYRRRLASLSAEEQDRAAARSREQQALERVLERFAPFEAAAAKVTMLAYYTQPAFEMDVLNHALPEVEIAAAPPSVSPSVSTPTAPSAPIPPATASASTPSPQVLKLQAYCKIAWLMAKADGRVAASERGIIRSHLVDRFGGDAVLLRHIDPQLEQAEAAVADEDDALASAKRAVPADEWPKLYTFAAMIAEAAGGRNDKEAKYLADLAQALAITTPFDAAPPKAPPAPAPAAPPPAAVDPRVALDIEPGTPITAELVRRKHALTLDRTAKAKALGGEFAAIAAKQEAEATAAALSLLAPLNEPLVKPVAEAPADIRHNPQLDDLFK